MKTGQTRPEGKTGKWYSKWLKTLFMDGDAIRSSLEFPLLEALIFHVEWLYGLIGCCVVFERRYRFLGLWLVTSEKTDDQVGERVRWLSFKKSTADVHDFPRDRGKLCFPTTSFTPFNGTHIHAHIIFYPLILGTHFQWLIFILSLLSP